MKEIIYSYYRNIKTLRTFVSSLNTVLLDKKNKFFEENELYFNVFLLSSNRHDPEKFPLSEELKQNALGIIDKYRGNNQKIEITNNDLNRIIEEVNLHSEQISLLYQSSLISLVTFLNY